MRRRFQIGMGVNPSLIINKGIYIQHVDGGLYTKENWSNKGYSNDLCNGIALVDKVCFSCESIRRIIDRGLLFNPVRITNVFC